MTKRQLIDQIVSLNGTANAGFLSQFPDRELDTYLQHLTAVRMPRPWAWRKGGYEPDRPTQMGREAPEGPQVVMAAAPAEESAAAGEPGGFFEDVRGVIQGRLF